MEFVGGPRNVVLNGVAFRIEQCRLPFTVYSVVMTGLAQQITNASTVIGIWGEILRRPNVAAFPQITISSWGHVLVITRKGRRSIST